MKKKIIRKLIALAGSVAVLTAAAPAGVFASEETAAETAEDAGSGETAAEEAAEESAAETGTEDAAAATETDAAAGTTVSPEAEAAEAETDAAAETTVSPAAEATAEETAEEAVSGEAAAEETVAEEVEADSTEENSVTESDTDELPVDEVKLEETAVSEEEAAAALKEETISGVFNGITIDGDFSDWAAVEKTPAGAENFYCGVEAVAVVQKDGVVYIYIRDTGCGTASWSGPNMNGTFEIISDLGYRTAFQLHSENNGASYSVSGVEGAEVAYVTGEWGQGGEWEISFPASQLPINNATYGFGFYLVEPYITGIADTSHEDNSKKFNGIEYDGLYGDWTYYPHTIIQYATPGTWADIVDGEGALFTQNNRLYGHVYTKMGAHLTEHGDEMTYGVVLRINGDDNLWFEFRLVTADEDGNVIWNPDTNRAADGTYEYYIMYHRGWSDQGAKKLDEILGNEVYGRMKISKDATKDEAEWYLDLGKIADLFGLEETDMQLLEVKYERIGDKWLQTAGASSGPVAGILLSMAVAGGAMVLNKKRKNAAEVL